MVVMAKSVYNHNQPSPTQLVTEVWKLFFFFSIYLSLENWWGVWKYPKAAGIANVFPWNTLKTGNATKCSFFHKCYFQMSCSGYPGPVYKVFYSGVSWWSQCLRQCGLVARHINTALRIWIFHFVLPHFQVCFWV